MKSYTTNENAPAGIYVSPRHLDICMVEHGERRLNGKPEARYYHIPFAALIIAGPVLGALFAFAFPAVIFYSLFCGACRCVRCVELPSSLTWRAGQAARTGVYVGVNRLTAHHVSAPDEPLGGEAGTRYLRIPTPLLLVLSPFLGAAYVIAFPVIAVFTMAAMLVHVVVDAVREAWERHEHLADLRWSPAAAYLLPENEKNAENAPTTTPAPEGDPALSALQSEIEARRETESRLNAENSEGSER
ncbi:hypothetical protein L6V77_15765 [Myxococcota bacterium]|nr:hypothetical protein [Myxococcota bacterium]